MLMQWLRCLDEMQYRNAKQYSLGFQTLISLLNYIYWPSPARTIRIKIVLCLYLNLYFQVLLTYSVCFHSRGDFILNEM